MFANVLIGDEINRGSPKTQSALLEVMEERQVTVRRRVAPGAAAVLRDRHPEPEGLPGHVHAARRPARPLHDAAQPRVHRPQHRGAAARGVQPPPARRLRQPGHRRRPARAGDRRRRPGRGRRAASTTTSSGSRPPPGTTPTSGSACRPAARSPCCAARAWAATAERDFVTPDDVQDVAIAVCAHRVALTPEAELRGAQTVDGRRGTARRGAGAPHTRGLIDAHQVGPGGGDRSPRAAPPPACGGTTRN